MGREERDGETAGSGVKSRQRNKGEGKERRVSKSYVRLE